MRKNNPIVKELRALASELFGTFALTFSALGAQAVVAMQGTNSDLLLAVVPAGLVAMGVIYSFGNISGAHINPAVTIAFSLHRAFAWKRVAGYVGAQFIGAIIAGLVAQYFFNSFAVMAAPIPHDSTIHALLMELVLTCLLVSAVIATATGSKLVGPNAGVAVSGVIVAAAIIGSNISGGVMNPAIAFSSLLISHNLSLYWIYLTGTLLGAILAVVINFVTHGRATKQESHVATGHENQN